MSSYVLEDNLYLVSPQYRISNYYRRQRAIKFYITYVAISLIKYLKQCYITLHMYMHILYIAINYVYYLLIYSWDITGQISPLCGFLYSNGTALIFVNEDVREVITKPVDTTYANHVSFYLLFGK